MKNDINHWLKKFLEHIEIEKGRRPNTVRNYTFYLERFFAWGKIKQPKDITLDKIKLFRLWLNRLPARPSTATQQKNTLKKTTQNYYLIALRTFLRYCAKEDIATLAPEKIELAKNEERQIHFLEGREIDTLLDAPLSIQKAEEIKLRDKAILEILFSTGMRVSECASLKRTNINLSKDEFAIFGKGGKWRTVFLSNQAKFWIKKYLEKRKDSAPFLFVAYDNRTKNDSKQKTLTPRSIERIVQKYKMIAGIVKKVTPHTLRHSFATDLLQNGADIRSIQTMLGHENISTTQLYTHITNPHLRDVHKAFHGTQRNNHHA
ncbi:MAG: tyrosine-type recombinase/integrase [Parcubacteria group bacterium]|nr:tyrosine-type recombinase/integrase [Parcubacteria group bacterium]